MLKWSFAFCSVEQVNSRLNVLAYMKRDIFIYVCQSKYLRHQGKWKSFWAYACLFCLRWAWEFETQTHALSSLRGPSHSGGGHGARMKVRREAFAFIPCHLAISQIYHLTFPPLRSPLAAHFSACPTHCLLSLSSLGISFLQTHLCVSLPPSHSYDLGVRAAPTPSQPWIKLPRHYSDVPPAMVLHVRGVAEPACLSRPAD